jgi:hypothetical protein
MKQRTDEYSNVLRFASSGLLAGHGLEDAELMLDLFALAAWALGSGLAAAFLEGLEDFKAPLALGTPVFVVWHCYLQ